MSQDQDDPADSVSGEALEYDCSPWAGETRRILRSMLVERGIPHAWEGTVVVVPVEFEEAMDEVVDGVAATARPSLGTARATVGYDVSAWSAASHNQLVDWLVERAIAYEWDSEGDLVVHEEDGERAEELIADLGDPDGAGELDGLVLHDRMGRLFVAADRLAGNPHDSTGSRDLRDSYASLETAAVPFGVESGTWLELHRLAAALLDTLDALAADDPEGRAYEHEPEGSDSDEADSQTGDDGAGDDGVAVAGLVSVQGLARLLRDLLRRLV